MYDPHDFARQSVKNRIGECLRQAWPVIQSQRELKKGYHLIACELTARNIPAPSAYTACNYMVVCSAQSRWNKMAVKRLIEKAESGEYEAYLATEPTKEVEVKQKVGVEQDFEMDF